MWFVLISLSIFNLHTSKMSPEYETMALDMNKLVGITLSMLYPELSFVIGNEIDRNNENHCSLFDEPLHPTQKPLTLTLTSEDICDRLCSMSIHSKNANWLRRTISRIRKHAKQCDRFFCIFSMTLESTSFRFYSFYQHVSLLIEHGMRDWFEIHIEYICTTVFCTFPFSQYSIQFMLCTRATPRKSDRTGSARELIRMRGPTVNINPEIVSSLHIHSLICTKFCQEMVIYARVCVGFPTNFLCKSWVCWESWLVTIEWRIRPTMCSVDVNRIYINIEPTGTIVIAADDPSVWAFCMFRSCPPCDIFIQIQKSTAKNGEMAISTHRCGYVISKFNLFSKWCHWWYLIPNATCWACATIWHE